MVEPSPENCSNSKLEESKIMLDFIGEEKRIYRMESN
jgi:hypothetical protein